MALQQMSIASTVGAMNLRKEFDWVIFPRASHVRRECGWHGHSDFRERIDFRACYVVGKGVGNFDFNRAAGLQDVGICCGGSAETS